jgi:hypothetical protein
MQTNWSNVSGCGAVTDFWSAYQSRTGNCSLQPSAFYAGSGQDPYQDVKVDYGQFWKWIFPSSLNTLQLSDTINKITGKIAELNAYDCSNSSNSKSCGIYTYNSIRALNTILEQYNSQLTKLGGTLNTLNTNGQNSFNTGGGATGSTTTGGSNTTTTTTSGGNTTNTPAKPSNMPLIIGGSVIGLLAVVGLIFAFSGRKKD